LKREDNPWREAQKAVTLRGQTNGPDCASFPSAHQKNFQAETAAELDAMLPSILDKAFKGELL